MQQRPNETGAPAGLFAALSFANFAIGIGAFVAIGVLSPIASGLQLSHSQAGMVMSIYALAYAIGSPLLISATGTFDRRRVILTGLGVFLFASVLCALSVNAEMLLASRALGALGAGMVTPVSAAIAAAKSPPERRGAALSFVILGLTLAQVAGIPLGSFLGYTAGWRAAFWLVTAITILAIAGVAWRVPKIQTPVTTLGDLGRTLASPVLIVAILITASMMGAAWILFTYFAPVLEELMGYGRNGVTFILVVFGAGAVIGNMLGGTISDRIGSVRSLIIVSIGLIVTFPLFSLLPMPDVALVVLTFVWGVIGWAFMAPQQSRIVALDPARQNVTLSLNASAIYAGAAVGSALGGIVIDSLGLDALGWVSGVAMVAVLMHVVLSAALSRRPGPQSG